MLDFKKTYTLPFKFEIPNYTQDFLDSTPKFKRWLKFIKRYLYIVLKGQKNLEILKILPKHQNILWINISAPSLGDSLMDLSSRTLLLDKKIDLFADVKNAHIYENDRVFNSVLTDLNFVTKSYDLVIIDSYSTRSIKIKSEIQPELPFIGMYGYYNGPEVNRVLFSFHRMNQLLGYPESESRINLTARVTISFPEGISAPIFIPNGNYITVALGGEWDYRTYRKWPEVIGGLIARSKDINIVLVGSSNAIEFANELMSAYKRNNIVNLVNQLTFVQTANVIKSSSMLFCCDGGLMHAANAVNTPIVSLFARLTPEMQLTHSILSFSNFDKLNVNNISPREVLRQYDIACKFLNI